MPACVTNRAVRRRTASCGTQACAVTPSGSGPSSAASTWRPIASTTRRPSPNASTTARQNSGGPT